MKKKCERKGKKRKQRLSIGLKEGKELIRKYINNFYVGQKKEILDILHDYLLANEIDISDSEANKKMNIN